MIYNALDSEVKLRAMEPEDLDWLYRIENNPDLWNVGATNVPYSRYALHDYIANSSNDIYSDRQVRFIIENSKGNVVGIVDLVNFDPQHLRAEIGIVIENKFRRHGYASMALKLVASYAKEVLHLHQLYAIADASNEASTGLFGKMGYVSVGRLTEWLYDGRNFSDAKVMQFFL